jgi:hypothetical protein
MKSVSKDLWSGILSVENGEDQIRFSIKSKSTPTSTVSVDLSKENFVELMIDLSKFTYGDKVYLDFGNSGRVYNCRVTKVAYTGSQIWYDVEVNMDGVNEFNEEFHSTVRLHNINGAFVKSQEDLDF